MAFRMMTKDPVTEAQIEVGDEAFSVEVKRLYLPVVIKAKCPNCGAEVKHDLHQHYLSYPAFNAVEKVHIMHVVDDEECCEFFVNVKLGFSATVVK
jgi:hypothetical protein